MSSSPPTYKVPNNTPATANPTPSRSRRSKTVSFAEPLATNLLTREIAPPSPRTRQEWQLDCARANLDKKLLCEALAEGEKGDARVAAQLLGPGEWVYVSEAGGHWAWAAADGSEEDGKRATRELLLEMWEREEEMKREEMWRYVVAMEKREQKDKEKDKGKGKGKGKGDAGDSDDTDSASGAKHQQQQCPVYESDYDSEGEDDSDEEEEDGMVEGEDRDWLAGVF